MGIVRLLLENGANANAENESYGNALSGASCRGHEGVVQLLLENGVDVNAGGNPPLFGNPLSAASKKGHEGLVQLLLENGVNLNAEHERALKAASEKPSPGRHATVAGKQRICRRGLARLRGSNKADFSSYLRGGDTAVLGNQGLFQVYHGDQRQELLNHQPNRLASTQTLHLSPKHPNPKPLTRSMPSASFQRIQTPSIQTPILVPKTPRLRILLVVDIIPMTQDSLFFLHFSFFDFLH